MEDSKTIRTEDTMEELDRAIEELEAKIAPGTNLNHNETLVLDTE